MHFPDLILKKRNGGSLSKEEIDSFISGYVRGAVPDYQVAALLMAIWFLKNGCQGNCRLDFCHAGFR